MILWEIKLPENKLKRLKTNKKILTSKILLSTTKS